jgi:hypothetical protein
MYKPTRKVYAYHFESKESIEASLVMWPVPSADDVAPSGCLAEPSPMWEGLHDDSSAGDWV